MQDALRFAGRAAGVQDEKRMFAVERFGWAIRRRFGHEFVPPQITARFHVHRLVTAVEDDALLNGGRFDQGGIDILLEMHYPAAPPTSVRRYDNPRPGIVVAIG